MSKEKIQNMLALEFECFPISLHGALFVKKINIVE